MDGRSQCVLVLRLSARQLKVPQAPWSAGDFPNFMTAGAGDSGDLGMLSSSLFSFLPCVYFHLPCYFRLVNKPRIAGYLAQ